MLYVHAFDTELHRMRIFIEECRRPAEAERVMRRRPCCSLTPHRPQRLARAPGMDRLGGRIRAPSVAAIRSADVLEVRRVRPKDKPRRPTERPEVDTLDLGGRQQEWPLLKARVSPDLDTAVRR